MIEKIRLQRDAVEDQLLALPNVVGVGTGLKHIGNNMTERLVIRVYVKVKASASDLGGNAVPASYTFMDGTVIYTDVQYVGDAKFYSFNDRERPAISGLSIGLANGYTTAGIQGGTLGAVVTDNSDGSSVIVSTNSTLADFNTAAIGSAIIQQAAAFGGSSPADDIGALKRFVTLVPGFSGNNLINGAVASITGSVNASPSKCSAIELNKHCAVGMLMAGSPVITLINDIADVEAELNVNFPLTTAPQIGQTVHKCGAATEYTAFTITDVDVTYILFGTDSQPYRFVGQALAAGGNADAAAGDSGAIVYTTKKCKKGKGY